MVRFVPRVLYVLSRLRVVVSWALASPRITTKLTKLTKLGTHSLLFPCFLMVSGRKHCRAWRVRVVGLESSWRDFEGWSARVDCVLDLRTHTTLV